MKTKSYLILLAGFALFSCNKHEVIPEPVPTSNIDSYFKDNTEALKQNFTVNNTTGGFIEGEKGVKITIPAETFVYTSGTTVAGEVDLELIEVLDYKQMVRTNKPTVSGDDILISGGQLKLTATKNGSQVFLADGAAVQVQVPVEDADYSMALYEGEEDENGLVNWEFVPEDTVIVSDEDSTGTYYFFEFNNPDLGWVNCDYVWDSPESRTTVSGILSDDRFVVEYTNAFIIFPDINSVGRMSVDDVLSPSYYMSLVPLGTQAKLIFISEIDDVYYKAVSSLFSVSADYTETFDMEVTTLDDIEDVIADM